MHWLNPFYTVFLVLFKGNSEGWSSGRRPTQVSGRTVRRQRLPHHQDLRRQQEQGRGIPRYSVTSGKSICILVYEMLTDVHIWLGFLFRWTYESGHSGWSHECSADSGQRQAQRQIWWLRLQQTGRYISLRSSCGIEYLLINHSLCSRAAAVVVVAAAAVVEAVRRMWWSSLTTTLTKWCWTVTTCGWWSFSRPGVDTARSTFTRSSSTAACLWNLTQSKTKDISVKVLFGLLLALNSFKVYSATLRVTNFLFNTNILGV